jgi:tight adherence protein B
VSSVPSTSSVLAAVLAALAIVLLGRPASSLARRPGRAIGERVRAGPVSSGVLVVATSVLVATVDGTRLALALVLLAGTAAVAVLARRAASARAAERRRAQVVEVCEALVGELRAGQPLVAALEHCRGTWPELEPVVVAARLGADVTAALRRLARAPGGEGLQEVAAAWQVSQQSGAGLATALGQVAATARARQATRQLVRGELASAQATARLVALLPVASLAMSAGIGGRPWHFLLATPIGLGCLAAGVLLVFLGLLWIDVIAAAVLRS